MQKPLVLVISKTSKNCKRSNGLWAIIFQRMRKVVYITAGYLIFEGQQKKSPFLARPHLQSSRGPPAEILFLLPSLYVVTSCHLV
jgi:hypothetical protein